MKMDAQQHFKIYSQKTSFRIPKIIHLLPRGTQQIIE